VRNKPKEIIIENKSKNLELEKRLVQFVEQEMNGVLIGDNRWKCDLTNSSWSLEQIKEELAFLVAGDPGGVVLWIRQKRRFWIRERWTQVAIHSVHYGFAKPRRFSKA